MRVLLTADPDLPTPPLHYGGIERVVDLLARALAARGCEVTLLCGEASTSPVRRVEWPGACAASRRDTLANAAALARLCVRERFDVVHSFSRLAYLAPILPAPIPKIMSYQRAISPRTTGLAARLARGTLAFTAASRSMLTAVPGRWRVIPNATSLDAFAFSPRGAPDAPFVFLGRIEPIKGPHLAIEIARAAGRKLVVAGEAPAPHRAWADAHVFAHVDGERVTYAGPVDDGAKSALLGQAHALLMPILWDEPFGIVMIEAMACGTPVLALRRGAAPEVVEEGVTGFLRDTAAELAALAPRVAGLSRAATRARVAALFSEQPVVEAYLDLYRERVGLRAA